MKPKFDPKIHHRQSMRLKGYDYSQAGVYFVTMVTWQRECLFGEVVDGVMRLSLAGRIVAEEWQLMECHFPNVQCGISMVMPNHFHVTMAIEAPVALPANGDNPSPEGATPHPIGPLAGSVGAMVAQFKSRVTKRIWRLPGMDQTPVWQRNFYDHIIRSQEEFERIWQYIEDNPRRWQEDKLHPAAPTNQFNQG